MKDGWSPQLIARVLAGDPTVSKMDRVSHETIYKALYVQSRGALRKDLYRKLSLRRKQRKARGTARQHSLYRDAFKISDRPAEVEDRAVPGHWEADLILGTGNGSAVGTLVERTTRFVILLHLPNGHDADEVATAMIRQMQQTARASAPLDHLRPGQRDGPLRRHPSRPEPADLLLQPRLPLAARQQREHQPAAAILAPRKAPTCPSSPPTTSTRSPRNSTPDPDPPWTCAPPPTASTNSSTNPNR